jgi:hypothetical protein
MSRYSTDRETAERLAERLTTERGTFNPRDTTTTRYIATPYPCDESDLPIEYRNRWGVVERWVYTDSPGLGELGGAFTDLTEIPR